MWAWLEQTLIELRLVVGDVRFARQCNSEWPETWRYVRAQAAARRSAERECRRALEGYDPHA